MSKMKDKVIDQQNEQPEYVADLLLNGTAVLESPTREELADLVNLIPADCKYMAGAVGRKADGSAYTLQVDIVKQ
jgi:hypothetical protein